MSLGSFSWQDVAIANGAAKTATIKLNGRRLIGIQAPASCEGASWTLYGSIDDSTYVQISNAIQEATGAAPITAPWEVSKDATNAQVIMLPDAFQYRGMPFIQLHSADAAAADVNQTGAQSIRVFVCDEQPGMP